MGLLHLIFNFNFGDKFLVLKNWSIFVPNNPDICILTKLMNSKCWDLCQVANNIGDDFKRLEGVMNGTGKLGKTAHLAIAAVLHDIAAIE